jgi:hypothetical protein
MKWVPATERLPFEVKNGEDYFVKVKDANSFIKSVARFHDGRFWDGREVNVLEWLDESADEEILETRIKELETNLEHAENAAAAYKEQFEQAVNEIRNFQ